MKSPDDLAFVLQKQWERSALRVERLLSADSWPLSLSIGKPTAAQFATQTTAVHDHVLRWKAISVGDVQWEDVHFRAAAEAISVPTKWCLRSPSEWMAVVPDRRIQEEYGQLKYLVGRVQSLYREALVSNRSLWRNKELDEVVKAAELADELAPGAAKGRPLRLIAGLGVDTKFFERNETLLLRLLDERFDGAASELGLVNFLDALDERDHWVLVVALEDGLLPFRRIRLTTTELATAPLPGTRVLVVENERCLHLLPKLADTIVILGAGLDLQWLQSDYFTGKSVGYWGDMDTWGLLMLSRARQCCPELTPLLMNFGLFEKYEGERAVPEPVVAQEQPLEGLTNNEAEFYRTLLARDRGRLEQEFLPEEIVHEELIGWVASH